jgi:hypothetical protein
VESDGELSGSGLFLVKMESVGATTAGWALKWSIPPTPVFSLKP